MAIKTAAAANNMFILFDAGSGTTLFSGSGMLDGSVSVVGIAPLSSSGETTGSVVLLAGGALCGIGSGAGSTETGRCGGGADLAGFCWGDRIVVEGGRSAGTRAVGATTWGVLEREDAGTVGRGAVDVDVDGCGGGVPSSTGPSAAGVPGLCSAGGSLYSLTDGRSITSPGNSFCAKAGTAVKAQQSTAAITLAAIFAERVELFR
ncbi:hypothetical protein [Parasphingorhabdus halotolerans]|uniref:Uncharacterized protein n=1 Tax=Parasphingorhabdus halotolerans TaxID=2725558 RepID=A0A6H2DRX9_9SPHN|nr:hypothetical protein [Parasphingorhabdus halotolerans]QJB70416.1 hypothetical protein HF685_15035 [Parasphingorhabdus halotolerans]